MSNQILTNNGGLPPQQINGQPARAGAISNQKAIDNKQLSLIGGRRRRRRMRGGTGSNQKISPPVVSNTGGTSASISMQQGSYNQLAGLSASVNENSTYDTTMKGGRKRRKSRRTRRTKRTRKNVKRRKYH
jgi:hypothetical protein